MSKIGDIISKIFTFLFRVNIARLIMAFLVTEAGIIGVYRWNLSGKIAENGKTALEGQISSSDADLYTVCCALIVLAGWALGLIIYYSIQKEKTKVEKKRGDVFQTVYAPIIVEIFNRVDYKNYPYWTECLAVNGYPTLKVERYTILRDLVVYCKNRQKVKGYEEWNELISNLGIVLEDTLNVFDMHSRERSDGLYYFHKFYKDQVGFNPNYDELSNEYIEESLLISDLTFELTRILNYILEKARKIDSAFLVDVGVLNVLGATDKNNERKPIEYLESEKGCKPYPGLDTFLDDRKKRTHTYCQYEKSDMLRNVLKREFLIQ